MYHTPKTCFPQFATYNNIDVRTYIICIASYFGSLLAIACNMLSVVLYVIEFEFIATCR